MKSRYGTVCLGLLINELDGLYQTELTQGFRQAARKHGANVLCFPGGSLSTDVLAIRQLNILYQMARQAPLDGMISVGASFCAGAEKEDIAKFCGMFKMPLLELGKREGISSVSCNNKLGMTELVDHFLVTHGFRRIAFIAGPAGNDDAEERLNVFRERHAVHGVEIDENLILPGTFYGPDGAVAVRRLLESGEKLPEAIISVNDSMAYKAIVALQEAGLRVPKDIAVAGFDDMASSVILGPGLTSVRQELPFQAETALLHMVNHVANGKPIPQETILPTRLIRRHSCGCSELLNQAVIDQYCISGKEILGKLPLLKSALRAEIDGEPHALRQAIEALLNDPLRQHGLVGDIGRCLELLLNQSEAAASEQEGAARILFRTQNWLAEYDRMLAGDAMVELANPSWRASDLLTRVRTKDEFTLSSVLTYVRDVLLEMGVQNAYMALFPHVAHVEAWDRVELPDEAQLVMAIRDGRVLPCSKFDRFPIRDLLPLPIFHEASGAMYTLLPLVQQSAHHGYLIIDWAQDYDISIQRLRESISSLVIGTIAVNELGRARDLLKQGLQQTPQSESLLTELAERDELTGLLNRRGLLEGVSRLRTGTEESLLLISGDLDGLKAINDKYGYSAGDEAIRSMAQALKDTFRGVDLLARPGGDEFVVVSRCPTEKLERMLCERLAESIKEFNAHAQKPWILSASFGIVRFFSHDPNDLEHWLALADERLFENKRLHKRQQSPQP